MYISPYCRSALEPPNFMKFGILGHLTDVITCVKFLVNRFRGYRVLTSRKWPFPIDLLRRPYNSWHCRAALRSLTLTSCETICPSYSKHPYGHSHLHSFKHHFILLSLSHFTHKQQTAPHTFRINLATKLHRDFSSSRRRAAMIRS